MQESRLKIVITGGAGFIGSHLCSRLLSDGHQVFCVDNLSSGNKENIKEFAALNSFVFLKHDMVDQIPLDSVDQIFNLACPASPVNYQKDPIKTIETCFFGALNALKLAENTGATVLQASTSEVYGDPLVHPQHETYWGHVNPIGTRACYDEGKRIAETLLFEYKRQRGVNIKCARIFNTYGPNMRVDDGRVVSNFLNQALLGNDITIYGSGEQTRSFCYVDDMVDALVALMNSSNTIVGPMNLGNPDEFKVSELASKVVDITGSKSRVIYEPLPSDDPKMRKPDIEKAKAELNWSPKVALADGLKNTLDRMRKKLDTGG